VYGSWPADIDELKAGIQEEITHISEETLLPNSCEPEYSTKWLSSKECFFFTEIRFCKR
jgi:hypothetical protein